MPLNRAMRVERPVALLTIAAGGVTAVRERLLRNTAERFAAAAFETLLDAIDANDAETGAHVRRVAAYALILAEAADLKPAQRRKVERVALFHDIGKVHAAITDIVHDGTSLSPTERRLIATHPRRGADVLAPLNPFYPDLAEGVLSHHERWDGTGYPRGLRGRRIPLEARIVTIADTFDAITHRRRYRGGRSAARAAQLILEGRGTQFDPELVDLFLMPPVFASIQEAMHELNRRPEKSKRRAGHVRRRRVPDVTFRWRPAALELPVLDRWR